MKSNIENTIIVVPIYNGAKHLKELFSRINKVEPKLKIIAINDASKDNTKSILAEADVISINFTENKGKGAALQAGFLKAIELGFDYAVSIDCDLQHEPEDIPNFMKMQNITDANLVIGRRSFKLGDMPPARIFSNSTTTAMVSKIMGQKVYDSQSGYRLYDLNIVKQLQFETNRYQFETEILLKYKKFNPKLAFVDILTIYQDEVSYISHGRDILNFIKILLKHM
jgi:glycosyltransferase involved in cell wall biosynthesis